MQNSLFAQRDPGYEQHTQNHTREHIGTFLPGGIYTPAKIAPACRLWIWRPGSTRHPARALYLHYGQGYTHTKNGQAKRSDVQYLQAFFIAGAFIAKLEKIGEDNGSRTINAGRNNAHARRKYGRYQQPRNARRQTMYNEIQKHAVAGNAFRQQAGGAVIFAPPAFFILFFYFIAKTF